MEHIIFIKYYNHSHIFTGGMKERVGGEEKWELWVNNKSLDFRVNKEDAEREQMNVDSALHKEEGAIAP